MASLVSRTKAFIQSLPTFSHQPAGRELAIQFHEHYLTDSHPIGLFERVSRLNHLGQVTFLVALVGSDPTDVFMHHILTCPDLYSLWDTLSEDVTQIDKAFVRKAVQYIDKHPRPF